MKKLALLFILVLGFTLIKAQDTPVVEGNVTLEMTDGKIVRGWIRNEFKNKVRFIEISETSRGERVRYDNDQVARVVFDQGAVYVKKDILTTLLKKKADESVWLREDYVGTGIALYSAYIEAQETVNNIRRTVTRRNFYIALGDDPAVYVTTEYIVGGVVNASGANRTQLNYYFNKKYPEYSDFAKRIKAKEFDTKGSPIDVVKAWAEAYGAR